MSTLEKEYTLSDLWEIARRAYCGTSFDPEKRANSIIREHSEELDDDLKGIPEGEHERYILNYRKYLTAWLHSRSKIYSSMITGPANFPVRRMEKLNRYEHNRSVEFTEWRERALKAIAKKIEDSKPQEQKDSERFEQIKKGILRSASTIRDIDNGTNRGSSRPLFVSSICGVIKRLAGNGEADLVNKCLDLIEQINKTSEKPIITEKNSVWKLREAAADKKHEQEQRSERENKTQTIKGVDVVWNYSLDRLQLVFKGKPAEEIRTALKKNGFKWSPSQTAWQRQLTRNAEYGASAVLKLI